MNMNDIVIPAEGEMSRQHRIILGSNYYGLYVLGMASTDFERTDEDCGMDNIGVPRRYEDLTEKHREKLLSVLANEAELKKMLSEGRPVTVALDPQPPIDVSDWTGKPTLKLFVYESPYAGEHHAAVLAFTKEQALALINAAKVKRFNEDWAAKEKELLARTPVPSYTPPSYISARDDVKLEEINEVLVGAVQLFDSGYD
jgi:hypothetical protein